MIINKIRLQILKPMFIIRINRSKVITIIIMQIIYDSYREFNLCISETHFGKINLKCSYQLQNI